MKSDELGLFSRYRGSYGVVLLMVICLLYQNIVALSCPQNDEGLALLKRKDSLVVHDPFGALPNRNDGEVKSNPCPWFGIKCSEGNVVIRTTQHGGAARRMLLDAKDGKEITDRLPSSSPSPSPSPTDSPTPSPTYSPSPSPLLVSPFESQSPSPSPSTTSALPTSRHDSKSDRHLVLVAGIGCSVLLLGAVAGFIFFICKQVSAVNPWATGLSGQLRQAFVTGVPNLKRSDIVEACEDFSNVIGSSSIGPLYKGTLSNGAEIAVARIDVEPWSIALEEQFRKKIDALSAVNHQNFINLIGYCEEDNPFTRMMVFEYASNGTLFEHLHVKEAEHLDWETRLRIIVGMAYCLEHMHRMNPPIAHKNLISSAINLTEDCAAKVSDFISWIDYDALHLESKSTTTTTELLSASPESNVYSFGVILFEIVTGRPPFSADDHSQDDWASRYLKLEQPFKETVDPTLDSFHEDQLERIHEVIKYCVNPDPRKRPAMREITERLRYVTGIGPEAAAPKLSPLWWAELEIISTEAS